MDLYNACLKRCRTRSSKDRAQFRLLLTKLFELLPRKCVPEALRVQSVSSRKGGPKFFFFLPSLPSSSCNGLDLTQHMLAQRPPGRQEKAEADSQTRSDTAEKF